MTIDHPAVFETVNIAKWTARTLQRYSIPSLFRFGFFFRVLTFPIPSISFFCSFPFLPVYVTIPNQMDFHPNKDFEVQP